MAAPMNGDDHLDDDAGYRWEGGYEKTWEAIQEDREGHIDASIESMVAKAKRSRLLKRKNVRLGMMRHLCLIVDASKAMTDEDLKPNRFLCTLRLLEQFIDEYFDQNPISQMGVFLSQSKRVSKVVEMCSNARKLRAALRTVAEQRTCEGELSIQNTLEVCLTHLVSLPAHSSREVLLVLGSLSTCDPGDVNRTIRATKEAGIRCSVIALAAETRLFRYLAEQTGGNFDVALDDSHLNELLRRNACPPASGSGLESALLRMGFPRLERGELALCLCHLKPSTSGYFCPQCRGKYCELPVECRLCGLTLAAATHLARCFHHLFPLDAFAEDTPRADELCFGCKVPIRSHQKVYRCSTCSSRFCLDCDLFLHEHLHTCPGCAAVT